MRVSDSTGFRGRVWVSFDIGFMVMTNIKGLGLRFSVWIKIRFMDSVRVRVEVRLMLGLGLGFKVRISIRVRLMLGLMLELS